MKKFLLKSHKGSIEALAGIVFFVLCVVVVGLFIAFGQSGEAARRAATEQAVATEIQKDLVASVPVPQLETSMERQNVAKRAEIFNKADKISYIYLIDYGKVMAFYTVKGKVSSLRSYMTPVDRITTSTGRPCNDYTGGCSVGYVVEAPDIDGTYGENVEGVFFFTTDNAYVEWRGNYMMSDQPLKLSTPPSLVRQID